MTNRWLVLLVLCFSVMLVSAEYALDISGLKSSEYSTGESLLFRVILLDGNTPVSEEVTVTIADALRNQEVIKTVMSNVDVSVPIEDGFTSGIWTVTAEASSGVVEREFTIGANLDVDFEIVGDELIIKNKGNVPYTKTVQITIGSTTNSYMQNIGVGEVKVLKLISAEGSYNIRVTDGKKTLSKENVQLFGTGNVIGAVDRDLVDYTGFASVEDVSSDDGRLFSLNKMPLALTFVVGVLVLGALVTVERRLSKKKK